MDVNGLIGLAENSTALVPVQKATLQSWLDRQDPELRSWVRRSAFSADDSATLILPGAPAQVLVGVDPEAGRWWGASLPMQLPEGAYRLAADLPPDQATRLALAWALGSYSFSRYRKTEREPAQLVWPSGADRRAVGSAVEAIYLVRDLINTPASDLGPAELAGIAENLASEFGATVKATVGEDLLAENFPLVHAVGRASARAPRLIDLRWGDPAGPKVTLVGKGVCFDTGGLNLKAWGSMLHMKLDMGGAAHVLALGRLVMSSGLPVRLRILIPAVENSVSGNAVRPRDVVTARNGLTVEVADTDAEGRLILADALAEASSERPDLIIDFATLTSAAFVALGPDIAAMFTNDDNLAAGLAASAQAVDDPLWRLPLWRDYASNLKGKVADLTNVADLNLGPTTLAGAIHAALFMDHFVDRQVPWAHFDVMAYNMRARPGRPEGGDARGLLAAFEYLKRRFGDSLTEQE